MTNIIDVSIDELNGMCNQSNLLNDWVNEQLYKINIIQNQLKMINELSADKLDTLCDYLEDIDYHISGVNNILSMVVGTLEPENTNEMADNEMADNEMADNEMADNKMADNKMADNSMLPKKWSLLHALWFHMIMKTDPESIYYSPRIGKDAWPSELI